VQQTFERVIAERSDFELECRIVRPDGTIRHIHSLAHPVSNESGELTEYVGTIIDITERKQAEEELHKMHAELAHVTRLSTLGELATSIGHEVNQPLAAIATNASAGLRWLAGASPNLDEARKALDRIIRDGNRASDVITRIRMLGRKNSTAKNPMDINQAIEEVIVLARGQIRSSGVALRTELAGDLPPVLGDRVQLQQVLLNLIMNGIEAMSGIEDRPRELMISTQIDDVEKVRVTVQDSGIGFDPQSIERIFEAFYTTKPEGMGIGLSISRSIIDAHGGRLWAARNDDGPGATFHFTLPVYRATAS
jgi:C4-dicarboxylate-specific signal transduction histidine kinase